MKELTLILITSFLLIFCTSQDDISKKNPLSTLINAEEFENEPSDFLTVNHLEISNDSLVFSFSASGCHGESWQYKLIDSGNIDFLMTTDEPSTAIQAQRTLRFVFKNKEECEAYITKTARFDISNLQVEGVNSVELNIINSNHIITYHY